MPLGRKKLRAAKHRRQNALTAIAMPAHTASLEGSVYLPSNNGSDDSLIDLESGNESNIQGGKDVKSSIEALQRLYSVSLPPHLRLKEKGQVTHRKNKNKKAVYSGDSQTTIW